MTKAKVKMISIQLKGNFRLEKGEWDNTTYIEIPIPKNGLEIIEHLEWNEPGGDASVGRKLVIESETELAYA